MSECLCNCCTNLKSIFGENGEVAEYNCEFGFPSEKCDACDEAHCEETCSHYSPEDETETVRIVKCKACGKELQTVFDENTDGDVFCINCYLDSEE